MAKHRLPDSSFAFYLGLGESRSFQQVADHFGVDKRTVTRRAKAEDWSGRVAEHERKIRATEEKKALDTLHEQRERCAKILNVITAKALETLRNTPIETGIDAVRALDLVFKNERLLLGEPTERTAIEATTDAAGYAQHETDLRKLTKEQRTLLRQLLNSIAKSPADSAVPPSPEATADAANGEADKK
jgi:hypothetical protein